jgi:uncharacterized protein YyaL (SSP411 family)
LQPIQPKSDRLSSLTIRTYNEHEEEMVGLNWRVLKENLGGGRWRPRSIEEHLHAAAQWLARAQDVTPDDGVAHSYDLRTGGWKPSYPETTGYIIPTLYDYAARFDAPEFARRAERMARWEVAEQLPEGGVRAGTMDADPVVPTIFNTGQVLFGLLRAWRESGDGLFLDALTRAADWLVAAQDGDGKWSRFHSPFSDQTVNPYNTRTAFGMAQCAQATGRDDWMRAAQANVEWALGTAAENGWLAGNCLTASGNALTHTIAYSIRGILEVGAIAGRDEFVQAALDMARRVAAAQRRDGALPGRLDPQWQPAEKWSCITGNSQMAINWLRLAAITGERGLIEPARRANRFNMSVQDLNSRDPGVRGGLKGSHPVNGEYLNYSFPNWAAKFFMDGLMLELDAGKPAG